MKRSDIKGVFFVISIYYIGDMMNFECKTDNEKWIATINWYQDYKNYYAANISARGSSLDILVGDTEVRKKRRLR